MKAGQYPLPLTQDEIDYIKNPKGHICKYK